VDVRGRTGIDIDESGSTTAGVHLEGEIPVASATYEVNVPFTCAPGPRDAACAVFREARDRSK